MTQLVSIYNQIDYNQLYHPFTWYITAHTYTHTAIHNLTVTAGIRIYLWHWESAINDVSKRCVQFQLHNLEPWLYLHIQTSDKYASKNSIYRGRERALNMFVCTYVCKYVCSMTMCRFFYHAYHQLWHCLIAHSNKYFDDKCHRLLGQ